MKNKNLFWGVYLILAATVLVLAGLNLFPNEDIFKISAFLLVIPIVVKSAWHLMFGGVFFPLAIVLIILNITNLSWWVILLVALLCTIGCHLIFGNPHVDCASSFRNSNNPNNFGTVVDTSDEDVINYSVNFGSSIKYINTDNFKRANLKCSFGALAVYFDNAKINPEGAEIYVDVSFGAIELYIPRNWKIVNNANVTLAGIDEKGRADANGIPVKLLGNVSLAGIEIVYI